MFINAVMAHKYNESAPPLKPFEEDNRDLPIISFEDYLQRVGKERDKELFVKLFEHFAPRIKSFLMKSGLDQETADEIAQESMLTVWHKAASFDAKKANASTWIFTIARNKKIDYFRKNGRAEFQDFEYSNLEDDSAGALENLVETQTSEAVSKALKALPKEQSELLYKAFFEDKSHSEIAKETRIPLGTIKSRIRLAIDKLRQQAAIKELK